MQEFTTNMNNMTPDMPEGSMRNPLIKDFAMPSIKVKDEDAPADTNMKRHTCAITFEAPKEINEHEMMDYIMGIEKALNSKVVKFSWSLSEDKK